MAQNPVAQYMDAEKIGTVEMAARLGRLSKGYVSLLKDGKKPITTEVAKRLGTLTGRPWWEFMPDDRAPRRASRVAAQ
jgi:transcriptional regulator with XRE-family HTH domain